MRQSFLHDICTEALGIEYIGYLLFQCRVLYHLGSGRFARNTAVLEAFPPQFSGAVGELFLLGCQVLPARFTFNEH